MIFNESVIKSGESNKYMFKLFHSTVWQDKGFTENITILSLKFQFSNLEKVFTR